jgi:hypothetical protein
MLFKCYSRWLTWSWECALRGMQMGVAVCSIVSYRQHISVYVYAAHLGPQTVDSLSTSNRLNSPIRSLVFTRLHRISVNFNPVNNRYRVSILPYPECTGYTVWERVLCIRYWQSSRFPLGALSFYDRAAEIVSCRSPMITVVLVDYFSLVYDVIRRYLKMVGVIYCVIIGSL